MDVRSRSPMLKRLVSVLLLVGMLVFVPEPRTAQAATALESAARQVDRGAVLKAFGRLPLYFVENQGQVDARVAYYVQGHDKTLYFTAEGLTYALTGGGGGGQRWVVQQAFVGANPGVQIEGLGRTGALFSYFRGQRDRWVTGVPSYAGVAYRELWPAIDLVYRGSATQLKYEFVVRPGADPASIQLAYRGATEVRLNGEGQLEVRTPLGGFTDDRPLAYQEVRGRRVAVEVGYALGDEGQYAFRLGAYDPSQPLVIDPAVLVYCGYIGSSGGEASSDIAVDGAGRAYVTGTAGSSAITFPVKVGPDLTHNGDDDAFVARVKADGTGLEYCGYIGGSGEDSASGIAVDGAGRAYVSGDTRSSEATFPVTVGPDLTFNGYIDAFVVRVAADGTRLEYCGYIGGSGWNSVADIAVDAAGRAYVTGTAGSHEPTFPVTVGPDLTHNGDWDAFVARVKADGTGLEYCGYIGGQWEDHGSGIAVDGAGRAYVIGTAASTEATFPVKVGPDLTRGGGNGDAFVARVKADGTELEYCGYIGGDGGWEFGSAIAVDGAGRAYVTGWTSSDEASFPVVVGPDLTHNGDDDAFVARVKADGTGLEYCGYIGGSDGASGGGIAVDGAGRAYVTGGTRSDEATFPVAVGPDLTHNGEIDAFVARVAADGTGLEYCGYIGGSGDDLGHAIAVDGAGRAYVIGDTGSDEATFPVVGGPDLTYNGNDDVFVAKVAVLSPDLSVAKRTARFVAAAGQPITYTLAFSNAGQVTASGVVITDTIPISVTDTSVISSGAAISQVEGTRYVWTVQDLAPGQGAVITISGVLSTSAAGRFTNTVVIGSATAEDSLGNNTSQTWVMVPTSYVYLPLVLRSYGAASGGVVGGSYLQR